MPRKPKTPQKQDLKGISGRDQFQTPNYAIDLLTPFLINLSDEWGLDNFNPNHPNFVIWEPAEGLGKITDRLRHHGFHVEGTDLLTGINFLTDSPPTDFNCIVTNPPFSLKKKFYEMCKGYGVPFALLIPADYSRWVNDAVSKDGCEKIIPDRRIDYITPNILNRIHEGEIWETVLEKYPDATEGFELKDFKTGFPVTWQGYLDKYKDFCNWTSIYDVPPMFLKKYSSSYYHSMWLCRGFNLGRTETFVELSKEEKINI